MTMTRRPSTPDSHDFSKRPYDLVKEFVIALSVVSLLTVVLAAVFSSPDEPAITMADWARADPADVVATATGELAGTTTSATYGAPYNHNADGQSVLGVPLQKMGGVRIPVDSSELVLQPLADQVGEPGPDRRPHAMAVGGTGPAHGVGDRVRRRPRRCPGRRPRPSAPRRLRTGAEARGCLRRRGSVGLPRGVPHLVGQLLRR